MSVPSTPASVLVVLDTNVVMDGWLFHHPAFNVIAAALADARVRWIATQAMRDELNHVLDRAAFNSRWSVDRQAIDRAWHDHAHIVMTAASAPARCRCSDPDDQKFIDLALAHRCQWLLTRDRALLRLARAARPYGVAIVPPERFALATDPA